MLRRDRKKIQYFFPGILFFLLTASGSIYADVGGGGSDVTSVSSIIHSIGEAQSLFNDFNQLIQNYDGKKLECTKIIDPKERTKCLSIAEEILEKAKDVLAKLNEQAVSIESEIAINKKRVSKEFVAKLDRLLSLVVRMRQEANERMKSSAG